LPGAGEILKIHRHALWEIPQGVDYEEAAVLDPICNAYKSIAQQSKFLPGQDVVVFGTGPLGLFSVQMARIMGAVNIVMVGLEEDVAVRFLLPKSWGDSGRQRFDRRCGHALPGNLR
jgi:threonine dehydrogenase-like Zn-dependent dehydrogenase